MRQEKAEEEKRKVQAEVLIVGAADPAAALKSPVLRKWWTIRFKYWKMLSHEGCNQTNPTNICQWDFTKLDVELVEVSTVEILLLTRNLKAKTSKATVVPIAGVARVRGR